RLHDHEDVETFHESKRIYCINNRNRREEANLHRKIFIVVCFLLSAVLFGMTSSHAANDQDTVYVIPIEASVEKGLYSFLKRAINIAEENDAKAIIFDIHTPGGAVDAATDIANLLS